MIKHYKLIFWTKEKIMNIYFQIDLRHVGMLLIFSSKIQKHVADSDRPYPNEINIATIFFNLK
jgi:hypothetical protein